MKLAKSVLLSTQINLHAVHTYTTKESEHRKNQEIVLGQPQSILEIQISYFQSSKVLEVFIKQSICSQKALKNSTFLAHVNLFPREDV